MNDASNAAVAGVLADMLGDPTPATAAQNSAALANAHDSIAGVVADLTAGLAPAAQHDPNVAYRAVDDTDDLVARAPGMLKPGSVQLAESRARLRAHANPAPQPAAKPKPQAVQNPADDASGANRFQSIVDKLGPEDFAQLEAAIDSRVSASLMSSFEEETGYVDETTYDETYEWPGEGGSE